MCVALLFGSLTRDLSYTTGWWLLNFYRISFNADNRLVKGSAFLCVIAQRDACNIFILIINIEGNKNI